MTVFRACPVIAFVVTVARGMIPVGWPGPMNPTVLDVPGIEMHIAYRRSMGLVPMSVVSGVGFRGQG